MVSLRDRIDEGKVMEHLGRISLTLDPDMEASLSRLNLKSVKPYYSFEYDPASLTLSLVPKGCVESYPTSLSGGRYREELSEVIGIENQVAEIVRDVASIYELDTIAGNIDVEQYWLRTVAGEVPNEATIRNPGFYTLMPNYQEFLI